MTKNTKTIKNQKQIVDNDESNDEHIEIEEQVEEQVEKQKKEIIELNNVIIDKAFDGLQENMNIFKALCEKKNKKEYNFEDIDIVTQRLMEVLNSIQTLSNLSVVISKYQQKLMSKRKFKRKDLGAEPRKPSGFTKPLDVPQNFKEFFNKHIKTSEDQLLKDKYGTNFDINEQHPRTTLTGIIFSYIRSKELYAEPKEGDKLNKKLIKLDDPLKKLFKVSDGQINGFKDFQTHMGTLYKTEIPSQSN